MPLCLDSFHALEEFYLNPWFKQAKVYSFVTPGVDYTHFWPTTSVPLGTYSLLDTKFTQGSECVEVKPGGVSVTSTTLTAYFDINSLSTNSALVTSIFVQIGSSQNNVPWSITIKKATWSLVGTAWVWVYTNQEVITNSPGSDWYNLASATIVVQV